MQYTWEWRTVLEEFLRGKLEQERPLGRTERLLASWGRHCSLKKVSFNVINFSNVTGNRLLLCGSMTEWKLCSNCWHLKDLTNFLTKWIYILLFCMTSEGIYHAYPRILLSSTIIGQIVLYFGTRKWMCVIKKKDVTVWMEQLRGTYKVSKETVQWYNFVKRLTKTTNGWA